MNMREYLNKNDLIGSIRHQLRHPSGTNKVWIIVEGETDQKLFSKLINGDFVEIEISYGGLSSLLESVSILLKETNRILGIRDADFLHLEGKKETQENIFLTDSHDSEVMLISCNRAYCAVVSEYLGRKIEPLSLRKKILKSVTFIGGIRWINDANSLELNFKSLGFGDFYNAKDIILDEDKCLLVVLQRSPNKRKEIAKEDVTRKISNVLDVLNLCSGHDFLRAFALFVTSNSKKGVNYKEISKAFRLAYSAEDFKETNLYRQLKGWADSNSKRLFNYP